MVWKCWWCGNVGGVEMLVVWKCWWCGNVGGVEMLVVWKCWWCGNVGGVEMLMVSVLLSFCCSEFKKITHLQHSEDFQHVEEYSRLVYTQHKIEVIMHAKLLT